MRPLTCALILLAIPALAQETTRELSSEQVIGRAPAYPVDAESGAIKALALYKVPAERFTIQLGPVKRSKHFEVRDAAFPSPMKTRWTMVHGSYYKPLGLKPGQRVPAAVVVHHLGGSFGAEAFMAQHLAQHGVAAFFISLPNYGKRQEKGTRQGFLRLEPKVAFTTFRQAALDVIRAGDFLRSMPEVDPERVGLVGVSLGAFVTAVARGVDTRFRRTVLVLGGGGLADMFSQMPEGSRLLKESGVDPAALHSILEPVDPLTFASRVNTRDVLMLSAENDEIVPRASTDALWEALGRPRIRWFQCGHYGIVLHILSVLNTVLDHLKS